MKYNGKNNWRFRKMEKHASEAVPLSLTRLFQFNNPGSMQ